MRFQTTDTVDAADANLVLTLLERNLLCISMKVVRSGDEIRAHGIGPSPRPINAHNTSTFRAEARGDGRILLTGDVEFQASALMEGSAQEPAVRSKIENAVRLTKAEVAMSQIAAGVRAPGTPAPVLVMAAPDSAFPPVSALRPPPGTEQEAAPPRDRGFVAGGADRLYGERTVVDRPHAGHTGGIQARPVAETGAPRNDVDRVGWVARQYPRATATAAAFLLLVATYLFGRLQGRNSSEVASDPGRGTKVIRSQVPPPEEQLQYDGPITSSKGASGTPDSPITTSAQSGNVTATQVRRRMGETQAAIIPGEPRSAPLSVAAPVVPGAQTPTSEASGAPAVQTEALPAGVADVRSASSDGALGDRLEQWAASMRSTDAAQQASFYAGHLDRYFLKTDVSHDFVLRDKADFLRRGKRVESFDLENVAVADRTDSAARIRLVKHYVVLASRAGPASEKMVRSELSLRKIDGTWEITGERDFK